MDKSSVLEHLKSPSLCVIYDLNRHCGFDKGWTIKDADIASINGANEIFKSFYRVQKDDSMDCYFFVLELYFLNKDRHEVRSEYKSFVVYGDNYKDVKNNLRCVLGTMGRIYKAEAFELWKSNENIVVRRINDDYVEMEGLMFSLNSIDFSKKFIDNSDFIAYMGTLFIDDMKPIILKGK